MQISPIKVLYVVLASAALLACGSRDDSTFEEPEVPEAAKEAARNLAEKYDVTVAEGPNYTCRLAQAILVAHEQDLTFPPEDRKAIVAIDRERMMRICTGGTGGLGAGEPITLQDMPTPKQ